MYNAQLIAQSWSHQRKLDIRRAHFGISRSELSFPDVVSGFVTITLSCTMTWPLAASTVTARASNVLDCHRGEVMFLSCPEPVRKYEYDHFVAVERLAREYLSRIDYDKVWRAFKHLNNRQAKPIDIDLAPASVPVVSHG